QGLHDQAVGVAIDDQAGEEIGLSVHHAASAAQLGVRSGRLAKRLGLFEPPREERLVDRLLLAGEQPDGDLALLAVERLAGEPAALVDEPDHLASPEGPWRAHVAAVHPDVPGAEPVEPAPRERYF